ncbi:AAA family ATPase [Tissierella carlieri]|uniref:AAA family ATPase n=1 Tax=Tissierella carlieri TaxID=689904 RepID=A0ABT1S8C0_9FIRM|nr:AAA family ATPase [Tissierella carlieri]MCQ4922723.1 AAA family ATPase [Tissierella carlieri]
MLLKELNLIGFGKFKNENIVLKDGINLIYGENEAGKSTLHSFIDGMFYGFLKPNIKRTDYLPEYEKYNPWTNNRYAGIIRFKYNGKFYRIERNFTKGEENTKVLDETTGVDITKNIEAGSGRVLQPGIHFFGFNTRVFSNTIFIKQLGTKTDDKLAAEVTEKLINVTTTLDDNISVDKAISELKVRMGEIGTDRASTKPYAKNLRDIERLQEEKSNILSEKDAYQSYLEEKIRLNNNLEIEMRNLSRLREKLLKVEILEKARTLEEAKILSDEIANLNSKIDKLSSYANISMDQYKESINLSNAIDFIDKNIVQSKFELENIENRLQSMDNEGYNDIYGKKIEEISKDYNYYEELEEEKNTIFYNKEDNKIEFLKRDYKELKGKSSKYKVIQIFSIILAIIAFGATIIAIITKKYLPIGILFIVFGSIGGYYTNKVNNLKYIIEDISRKIEDIYNREKEKQSRIEEIEKLKKSLLEKYNTTGKMEFKKLLDRLQIEHYRQKEQIELYNELKIKRGFLLDRIYEDEFNKKQNLITLEAIFTENNVRDIQEFNYSLDKRNMYEQYIRESEGKKEILRKVLGQHTIEDLIAELGNFYLDINNSIEDMDKNQIKYQIDRINENISDIKIALRGAEENLNILGKDMERLVVIEEEIERKIKYKEELENKYKSLEIAAQAIEELSRDIHSQFTPEINKKVSKIVEKITEGKYNNIKISESLNISVENPITREIIDINSLSGGTIDQLYFSLRFGIINSMVDNKLPLILDDCFIQYDDSRLKNIIEFLTDIGNERQVILFTCHNREKKALEDLGAKFNLINLK